ncbi:G-type lectin S-receptor-like serine/threonine-protein kinase At4g27290 isoform X2 [Rhododendron vialii]|uniref:G-type lectin S-receptor-like serine/threonine-protein kinase At4g27290 isoform X2 n=1 Tax=Rhododendron vialii TaxID=182163 RepID=UPI00265E2F42|nr:G-type lectin S-receptor-like serine/threonine-protein kinase At4g27290 isoform X2 [Rhododendron vialii]
MGGFAIPLFLCCTIFSTSIPPTTPTDTITPTQTTGVYDTVVSAGGNTELRFFTPSGKPYHWYLGIWYKKISTRTVVWVANREIPLTNSLGILQLTQEGNLQLVNSSGSIIWSSNVSRPVQNPVAQLLDNGNLVVREGNDTNPENFSWESFDFPTDNLLAGMKFGRNLKSGLDRYLTSWRSTDDPAPGNFTYRLDLRVYPELILRSGDTVQFRSGPWNGLRFSGFNMLVPNPVYTFGSPPCWCLNGFVPNFPQDWDKADWSQGCVRRVQLDCLGDGFVRYSGVKLPDTKGSWFNVTMSLDECQRVCLEKCNCTAYTSLDIRGGGSGCLLWFGDLIDIREYHENGQDLYIRMAASESDTNAGSTAKKKEKLAIAASVVTGGLLFLGLSLILWMCKRKQRLTGKRRPSRGHKYTRGRQKEELELPLFDLATISKATNNFSEHNKLGEGGFGSVYKGILMEGQEIAVKRLSKDSRQGIDEFKNEVNYIAKLQHRNLVKILGCCIQLEEKMLVYEYMFNKSLDCFIFDEKRSMLLDWPNRFNIIIGIARGFLYLHQDSRLRIIHRDLKAENVLLDNEMNPKISDFGLARCFRGSETEANTKKVVGTHGYISPEYAVHGVYSMKSDVFSFGVLVLEILSGKRNRSFHHPDHDLNLLGHAWKLYIEGRSLELVDALVRESWCACEVLRSIHVGLLCVQQSQEDRPNMSTVVVILGSEGALPRPKQPAFFTETSPLEADSLESKNAAFSGNEGAISEIEAR